MQLMYANNEAPGSEILKYRQAGDTPASDYLMTLPQGMFSGKAVGDLDSVPGYYGGTASYKFVQNAHALNQARLIRHFEFGEEEEEEELTPSELDAIKQDALSGIVLPTLTPSESRIEAYEAAKRMGQRPPLKGPARGYKYKVADQYGARKQPKFRRIRRETKGAYKRNANGDMVWVPGQKYY